MIRGNEEKYLENLVGKDQSQWTDGQMQVSYWCYRNLSRDSLDYLLGLPHTAELEYAGIPIHMAHSSMTFLGTYPFYTWNSVTVANRNRGKDADPAKILADSIYDLLTDGTSFEKVISNFKPKMTLEQYLDYLNSNKG